MTVPGNRRVRRLAVFAATGAAAFSVATPLAPAAFAEDGEEYEQPPGYVAPQVPEIPSDAPGLMLGDGATLAPPRVLDVKFVTEDLGGETGGGGTTATGGTTGGTDGSSGGHSGNGGGEQREERVGDQHKFTLQSDVLFERGSADISEGAQAALGEVAAAIEEYQPSEVNVFGFTDNLGSYESGVTLSTDRARNAHGVLIDLLDDASGIQFNVRGYSEDYPIYDNSTEEGRQRNRRVEISFPSGE